MPADRSSRPSLDEARKATADAAAETSRALNDLAKHAGEAMHSRLDGVGVNSREYVDYAGERFGGAQDYLVAKIKERPVQSALTALGVGVVLGVLLAR